MAVEYGVMVAPDPEKLTIKWFLHTCTCIGETFQYEPDTKKYYRFASMSEAQEWLNKWYAGRAMCGLWLPPISRFSIQVIPD